MTNVDMVRLAGSRQRLSEHPTVDPVTAEVIRGGMETICFEMAMYVSRTATTPILNQSIERHHGDTGGAVPGGYNVTAADIWGEGVRWPVVKVIDRGVERRDVLYALQANNRIPDYIGDLRAQIGSAQLGVQRLSEILDR